MLAAEDLAVRRGGTLVVQIDQVSLKGGLTAVMGPNGAGKTSLLLALADRLPYEGTITRSDPWLTGTAPPMPALVEARELVEGYGVDNPDAWLDNVGYQGPTSLANGSTGERMLVAIAGALGTQGRDLLFDEPFGHLDPPHVARLAPLFKQRARHDTVLYTTHHAHLASLADRVLLLNQTLTRDGRPKDVLQPGPLSDCYGAPIQVEWTPLGPVVQAQADENP